MSHGLDKAHLDTIDLKLNHWKNRETWDSKISTGKLENIYTDRSIFHKNIQFQVGDSDDDAQTPRLSQTLGSNESIARTLNDSSSDRPHSKETNPDDVVTVKELKHLVPLVFANNKSLTEYFNQELFFAANLKTLPENFEKLAYKSGSIRQLTDIHSNLNRMMNMINKNYENLVKRFELAKQSMNLQIFSNVKYYKNLNNSRVMINGLVGLKMMFQDFIQLLHDLDNFMMDINDRVEEWNDSPYDTNDNDMNANGDFTSKPLGLNNMIYNINNNLSNFSNLEFDELIKQTILIFTEFVDNYHKEDRLDSDFFNYEIVLFDDHLKSVLELF